MAGLARLTARRLYLQRPRPTIDVRVHGFWISLDPHELVDGLLLFTPHLVDRPEIAFLGRHLITGGTFLDLGAYIGLYSLLAARAVGPTGRVLAVEPDPHSARRLRDHVTRNHLPWITPLEIGLTARVETRRLGIDRSGNRGSSSFLRTDLPGPLVDCAPLSSLLEAHAVTSVTCAKLDLEGLEHPVLAELFRTLPSTTWPRAMIVERLPRLPGPSRRPVPDLRTLLTDHGYRVRKGSRHNLLAERCGG